jgi:hypothetical protein
MINDYEIGSPEDILLELSQDLLDKGLFVSLNQDNKFNGLFYLNIEDRHRIFCDSWPKNELDWLYNKPIMLDFYKRLEVFGLKRDRDYKLYGGGINVNLVFEDKSVIKL